MDLNPQHRRVSLATAVRTGGAPFRRRLYLRWVVACALAELIGIGTAAAVAVFMRAQVGSPATLPAAAAVLLAMAAAGCVEGGALGWLQARVLRERIPSFESRRWIACTVAVAVLGWMCGMAPSLLMHQGQPDVPAQDPGWLVVLGASALLGAAAGTVFGAAQWLVLRRRVRAASRWIWIHALGWMPAMAAIFAAASLPDAQSPPLAIVLLGALGGLIGGSLLGAITGVVAADLEPLEEPRNEDGHACRMSDAGP
jgi:hypothetical protein